MRLALLLEKRSLAAAGLVGVVALLTGCNALAPTTPMRVARYDHTATLLVSGRALVVGGRSQAGVLASAERYERPPAVGWRRLRCARRATGTRQCACPRARSSSRGASGRAAGR